MVKIAKVKGAKDLLRKLEKMERDSKRKNNGSVVVGYSASYAIYVHEMDRSNTKSIRNTKGSGGASKDKRFKKRQSSNKFLEIPIREHAVELKRIIAEVTKNSGSLVKGLLAAGLRIQRESQKIVPVDTGNLKGSAFTDRE